ncbi:MAG: hypothetical protein KDA16_12975 [Phycisphaerales bacterium]|nr:hypothetical protein [Phycisphaerales bacterium]
MTPHDEHHERLIDAILAQDASPADRAEFDRLMRDDADFRAEFELARKIDDSITRWSDPPAAAPIASIAPARSRRALLATAATLALVGAAAVIAWQAGLLTSSGGGGSNGGVVSPYARLNAEQIYRDAQAAKFIPEWRCETDAQFVKAVQGKTGRAALLPLTTPGIEIVGWKYSDATKPAVSSSSMWLFVRTSAGPAVVIVDRLDKDQRAGGLATGGSPDFHAFRREINGLVLYEITPEPAPSVIDQFVVPPSPDDN